MKGKKKSPQNKKDIDYDRIIFSQKHNAKMLRSCLLNNANWINRYSYCSLSLQVVPAYKMCFHIESTTQNDFQMTLIFFKFSLIFFMVSEVWILSSICSPLRILFSHGWPNDASYPIFALSTFISDDSCI